MTEFDPQSFEAELKRLKPASPPAPLMARLGRVSAKRPGRDLLESVKGLARQVWPRWFWWTAAATGALVMAVALLSRNEPRSASVRSPASPPLATTSKPTLKAEQVEIDKRLLSSFDAIASLPSGEPVRFHCREWMEQVTLRDSVRGVVIERQSPRLEVIPVRFETY